MFDRRFIPFSTLFELTLRCNMRCIHCGSSAGTQRIKELTTDEWIKVVKDLADLGCKYITLLGGEPFVRKDWYEVAKAVKDNGMALTIISNGLLVDEEMIKKLRKLDLYTVAISLDGGSAATHDKIRQVKGSFEQCEKAFELLKEAGIKTTAITTVNKLNFDEIPQIRDYLLNKQIAWQIQVATPIGRFPKELMLTKEEFYSVALFIATNREKYGVDALPVAGAHCFGYHSKILPNISLMPKWVGCQGGISILGIQSDGGVKGCLSMPDEFIQGNLRKKSLSEIWYAPDFADYNRKFKKENLNGECKGCKYGKSCRGGCLSVSTSVTGMPHADPYCFRLIEKSKELTK